MNKLKGLLLTEGLHGMISQVEGLAKALDLEYFHERVELNSPWNLIPPSLTPKKKFIFKNQIKYDYDVIISCGRKSVVPSILLKKKNAKNNRMFEDIIVRVSRALETKLEPCSFCMCIFSIFDPHNKS